MRALAAERLAELSGRLDGELVSRGLRLRERLSGLPTEPPRLREALRREVDFPTALVFDPDGRLVFPPLDGDRSAAESALLERTRALWEGGRPPPSWGRAGAPSSEGDGAPSEGAHPSAPTDSPVAGVSPSPTDRSPSASSAPSAPSAPNPGRSLARGGAAPPPPVAPPTPHDAGWHTWYWADGLNLLYWHRRGDGHTFVVEQPRIVLLAALVERLPSMTIGGEAERVELRDSADRVVYQWGALRRGSGATIRIAQPLAAPLAAWRLAWSGQPVASGPPWGLLAGLGGLGLALAGLTTWSYRASAAELRRAAQRVSFVNQVSHELKTPLTNIRLYAELLEEGLDDLPEDLVEPRVRRHLSVIVGESQRLSRLIANVLTFARSQREQVTLRWSPGVVDDCVVAALESFAPALSAAGIAIERSLAAPTPIDFDPDALGQILANLLSNVEKYAASGGRVAVDTEDRGAEVVITVADSGPGIPRDARHRIFEPFERLDDASTAATGTGIGLSIARELARLHGGELSLVSGQGGARFEVRLPRRPMNGVKT